MAVRSDQRKTLEAEIRRLPDLSLAELRDRWKALFGNPAPLSLRRKFLARAVAYQMQVKAHGGPSNSTRRRLREIAEAVRRGNPDAAGVTRQIRPGTQMIRQWRDETHIVTAIAGGFEWNGQTYKSLSAVAKEITGTNWNGYAFFGIKRASIANKNAAGPHRMSAEERSSPDVRPASVTVKADRSRSRG
jgi:ABC-type branched-subunit amino acid transport system substrate-binding protein